MPLSSSDLRRRVLAEFRGYREPRPLMDKVQPASALIAKVMQTLGLGERVRETEIQQAWQEIVGDFLASNSHPHRLKDLVLHVRVLQPAVHYEIEQQRGAIVAKLKARFGSKTVRDVRFRVG